MLITEALEMLEQEICRCEDDPDMSLSDDYREGFVKGLQQAKYLLEAMMQRPMI